MLAGIDPDFHRRDLADAIESGAYPQWELGVQVFPDTRGGDLRGHRPARPDEARARGARPGAADRPADADRQPDQLLRRDRAGRLPRRQPGARHRRHQRPAAAGAAVLLRRHPADPAGRAELRPDPDQPAARAGQRHAARRLPPARRARRRGAVPAELAGRRLPVPRRGGAGTARSSTYRRTVAEAVKTGRHRRRTTTTSARCACSGSA